MSLVASNKEDAIMARLLAHMQAVRDHWHSIVWLKDALDRDDEWAFKEVWEELGHEVHKCLWVAPSKGGIWTTAERKKMREWQC
jgi:recombination protein RecT